MLKAKPLRIKGIHRIKRKLSDGSVKVYYYHRASNRRVEGEPNTPAFLQSVADAEKSMRRSPGDTITGLIRKFDSSAYFDKLSETTRREYVWKLKRVEARWGDVPVETFNDEEATSDFRKDVLEWQEELAKASPRSADNLLATLARVLSFAKEKSAIKYNPLDTFKRVYKSDRSEKVWSDDLVKAFVAAASKSMVTAMYLARDIGQRQKDIRQLAWKAYDGKTVEVRQSKSKKLIRVPVTHELKQHLDGIPKEERGLLMLVTPTGKAFTKRHFNNCWREDANKIGAADLNFHDLRGTAATRLAEAGATAFEIASVMGWSIQKSQKIIDTYVARNSTLAANAIAKLEAFRGRTPTEQ